MLRCGAALHSRTCSIFAADAILQRLLFAGTSSVWVCHDRTAGVYGIVMHVYGITMAMNIVCNENVGVGS